jgi:diguanylate cyclase (GGDEF)-like protein
MTAAPRIDAIRKLGLDALPDRDLFSRITVLASKMLDCPIALLSIIEDDHQWFLGRTGIELDLTPIDESFCAVCILGGGPLLVSDASADPRMCDSALVTGAPFIRSYLGVPIRAEDGVMIGELCAISPLRDAFSPAQIAPLAMLAELAEKSIALHARTRELSLANAALQQTSQIFRQAEGAANVGSWRVDLTTGELHWSDQVYVINGLDPGQKLPVESAIDLYEPEDRTMVTRALEEAVREGKPFSFETTINRRDGQQRRIRVVGERVDVGGQPDSVAGVVLDCTDEHLRNVALKRAAERDQLTGLHNRASFDRRLARAMQRVKSEPVTVALLDLDGFKDVNDTLGHLVGDKVLQTIAHKLKQHTRSGVFLARWGGDEFAMLFPASMSLDDVSRFLKDLLRSFGDLAPLGNAGMKIGATCGIARMDTAASSEEIMRRADLALYRGKEEGRGTFVRWDEQIEAHQSERQQAIARLRQALVSGRIAAAYQPIIDLESGAVVSVEALLRLRDETGALLVAGDVFAALLDPDLSRQVSRVMLDQIVADGLAIQALFGSACRIGLNLSEADLRHGDFVRHLIDVIDDSALSPANVTIEVTETMLIDARGQVRASLAMLDACGFTICLDDFGTGFSSLTHLRAFPIHKVKIDRDFIAGIGEDHQSRLIVQAIVQMSNSLGLRVVAEGVETEEQEIFLRAVGCRHVQGYRYGRPALLEDLRFAHTPPTARKRA